MKDHTKNLIAGVSLVLALSSIADAFRLIESSPGDPNPASGQVIRIQGRSGPAVYLSASDNRQFHLVLGLAVVGGLSFFAFRAAGRRS
jgi:hypothetical protein